MTTNAPPMIATPQLRKARFCVTFPDEDVAVHFCSSVDSLTKILQEHRREITKWQVYSLVSPNDRRSRHRKSKSLLLGAEITRIDQPSEPAAI
jgi:hypothetical protein